MSSLLSILNTVYEATKTHGILALMVGVIIGGAAVRTVDSIFASPESVAGNTASIDVLRERQDSLESRMFSHMRIIESLDQRLSDAEIVIGQMEEFGQRLESMDRSFQRALCRADGSSAAFCERTIR